MELKPIPDSSQVVIDTGVARLGNLLLWVPEGACTDRGLAGAYPVGTWAEREGVLHESISGPAVFGPGNVNKVDENTLECCNIQFPAEGPVSWKSRVRVDGDTVHFDIRLTNAGQSRLAKAGTPICMRFLDGSWWSDEGTFVASGGRPASLAELGRDGGQKNDFQAYLLVGQSFGNVFYREYWGFSRHRLDGGPMVSECREAGMCVGIESESAYFLHSNRGNPCTDVMLAFGDLEPGSTASATGRVWVKAGSAADFL